SAFNENIDDVRRPTSRTASPRPLSRNEQTKPRPNYAVREADAFYYRRPDYSKPLNPSVSTTRRLGTGPADPTGPIAIAGSWLRGIFRGNPEKGKFEVVRGNAARATEIPLTESATASGAARSSKDDSRPSSAGRGEDIRSPLVVGIVEEENEDSVYPEDEIPLPSTSRPIIPEVNVQQPPRTQHQQFPMLMDDDDDDDDTFTFPPLPPKNPNRASVSSLESITPSIPPSIPRKSSARASPRVHSETPWNPEEERVREVKTGRGVWTEQNEGS